MLVPRTELTATIAQVMHRFEAEGVELRAKTVKASMKEDYWFVKLDEDAAPPLAEVKRKVLVFM
jgi:hypothetical protein